MRRFIMGASFPALVADPTDMLLIAAIAWLLFGMWFATVTLIADSSLRRGRSAGAIFAAWCVVVVVSPWVMVRRAVSRDRRK